MTSAQGTNIFFKMRLLLALALLLCLAPLIGATNASGSALRPHVSSNTSLHVRQAGTFSVDEDRLLWPDSTTTTRWPTTQSFLVVGEKTQTSVHTSTAVLMNTVRVQAQPAASTEVTSSTTTDILTLAVVTATPATTPVACMATVTVTASPVALETVTEYSRGTMTITVTETGPATTIRMDPVTITTTVTSTVTGIPVVIPSTVTLPASTLDPITVTLHASTPDTSTVTLPGSTLDPITVTLPGSTQDASTVTLPGPPQSTSIFTLPSSPASTIIVTLPSQDASTTIVTMDTPVVTPADPFTYDPYTPYVPHIVAHSFDGPRSKDFNTEGVEAPLYPTYTAINRVDPPGRSYIDMYETLKKRGVAYVPSLSVDEKLGIWHVAGGTAPTPAVFGGATSHTTTVVTSTSHITVIETLSVAPVTSIDVTTTTSYTILGLDTFPAKPALGKRAPKRYSDTKWSTSVHHHLIPGGAFPTEHPWSIRAARSEHVDDRSAIVSYTAAVESHTLEAPILPRGLNASETTVAAGSTQPLEQIMAYTLTQSQNGTALTTHTLKIPIAHLGYTPSTRPGSPNSMASSTRVPTTFKTLVTRD